MSRFVGELAVAPCANDWSTWYLLKPIAYECDLGVIKIPEGFETDFASVPTLLTNLMPRWGPYGLASIVHDWLYWNQHTTREQADDVLLEAMGVSGVPAWRRSVIYRAVRAFGEFAWMDNARIASEGYSRVRTAASPDVPAWSR